MIDMIVSASAPPVRRSLVTGLASALLAVTGASIALGQQPKPPAAQAPRPAQAQAAPGAQQEPPPLIYSPWMKFCLKTPDGSKQVCVTGREARSETGYPLTNVQLIEPEGEPKKILRVTVPMPVALQYGTRVIIDQGPANPGVYQTCFTNGCMSDFEASPDFIAKLKTGTTLQVQAINYQGQGFGFPIPLADFKKANEGPPTDPKVLEEQQKKLQEELQKRADEARKKLEAQQPAK
jgi:invasion protein IalB